jgi:hypothetical protein
MRTASNTIAVIVLAAVCSGCIKAAKPAPIVTQDMDVASRRALYEEYRLTEDRGLFSVTWKRADGAYSLDELEDVVREFPEAASLHERAGERVMTLAGMAGGFGGGLALTFGYNLLAKEEDRWSRRDQVAMYAVGGAGLVLTLVLVLAWPSPARDLADVYNRELRLRLGIDVEGSEGVSRAEQPMWLPTVGAGGAEWRF